MNKRQKEVLQSSLTDERNILDSLKKNYTVALADIKRNIRELQANPLTQSKAYQLEFQKQLEKQISGILDNLQGKNFTSIADYMNNSYRNAFIGNMYDMQGQGVPLVIPIDEQQVLKSVQKTGDDFKLSNKLGGSINELKKQIKQEVIRGFATELTYNQIARNISDYGEADFNRSARIARTEGHRIQNEARMDSMQSAKKKGADIVKQWDATFDNKTRPEHAQLDGQIRELDEKFTVGSYSSLYPGGFGDPYMDCNCRCCVLQRARWAVENEKSYQKWNNETGGFIECTGFEDFKEKYLEAVENYEKSGIIKMYRKGGTHRKVTDDGRKVIDKPTYQKITSPAIKKGADIRVANESWMKHLQDRNATAVTIGDTIIFRPDATVSDVLEETHHFMQNKSNLNDDKAEPIRTILNEIDAKKYVLSMSEKYNIPDEEIQLTLNQLKQYEETIEKMKKRGEWLD